MIDEEGYVHIMSRSDDIINVAAHRLSTGSIEEVIATHHSVAECCVVGMPDSQKGIYLIVCSIEFRPRSACIYHGNPFRALSDIIQRSQRPRTKTNRRNCYPRGSRCSRKDSENTEWEDVTTGFEGDCGEGDGWGLGKPVGCAGYG